MPLARQMAKEYRILNNPIIEIELAFIKVQILFGLFYFVLFNYLLIPNEYFSYTKEKVNLIVYGILSISLLYIFFYKLIKRLSSNYKYHLLSFFILAFGLYITSLLYQEEIELTRFEITLIASPLDVHQNNRESYFAIKHYYIDKNICLNDYDISYSTKHTDIYVKDYFLMPLIKDSSIHNDFRVWLGLTFAQNVNNRILSRGNVENEILEAHERNHYEMYNYNYKAIKYFYKVKSSEDYEFFENALNGFKESNSNQNDIILSASLNDLNKNRTDYLIYILISILGSNILFQVLSFFFIKLE